jgi:hypothetical protein
MMAILEQRGPVAIHCEFGRIVCWQKEIMTLDWHCIYFETMISTRRVLPSTLCLD